MYCPYAFVHFYKTDTCPLGQNIKIIFGLYQKELKPWGVVSVL